MLMGFTKFPYAYLNLFYGHKYDQEIPYEIYYLLVGNNTFLLASPL